MTQYPFVPGREVIGTVSAVGIYVLHLATGDRVGLGWHAGYCMTCDQCLDGHHNLCAKAEPTIVSRYGGIADKVRAQAASVAKLPDELDGRKAGPLLCGGMAVFNPLVQLNVSPSGSVGVIGIGGLGHLALKFARAWGVTSPHSHLADQSSRRLSTWGLTIPSTHVIRKPSPLPQADSIC